MSIKLILGYPSSSKSTVAKTYIDKGFINLNRDTEGGKIIDLLPKLETILKDGKDVVLDNLFPTIEVRKPFIDMAKKYKTNIEAIVLDTSIEDSQINFCHRMIDISGKILSPDEFKKAKHPSIFPPLVFFKYRKDFQAPSKEEGFDEISNSHFERNINKDFVNQVLFLDYDGTLRECIGWNEKYPTLTEHIKILPNRTKILKEYQNKGYRLLGVSNQSGVHKGELTFDKAAELFEHTNKLLDVSIETFFCPHSSKVSCYCRKPGSGAFIHFQRKYNIDFKKSFFVGDFTSDETAAKRCGIPYIDQADFFK